MSVDVGKAGSGGVHTDIGLISNSTCESECSRVVVSRGLVCDG